MTELTTEPADATTNSVWTDQLAALKDRFHRVRDTILFTFHVLQTDPDIAIDDLKARAMLHGLRVTTATMSSAERLLARNPATDGLTADPRPSPARRTRPRTGQTRAARATLDVDALIRATVAKIDKHRAAEAEALREVIRKAMAMLQAAVGA